MKKISKIEQMRAERKQLEQQIAKQKAIISEQTERLSRSKIVKEYSEIFVDKQNNFIKYSNLSETKKYFESNEFDILKMLFKTLCVNENNEKKELSSLTSSQFHEILASSLSLFVNKKIRDKLNDDDDEFKEFEKETKEITKE